MVAHLAVTTSTDLPEQAEQPLLTYCDDATGERTELTAKQLGDWAARTAGLLRDGCGLGPGSRVAVLLPPHWRTAAVLLGAWSVGLAVSSRPRATAGLPVLEPGGERPYDAVFVTPERLD
ncbi:TIGR03089 family protein, partial [Streptomyces sp. NPDC052644]